MAVAVLVCSASFLLVAAVVGGCSKQTKKKNNSTEKTKKEENTFLTPSGRAVELAAVPRAREDVGEEKKTTTTAAVVKKAEALPSPKRSQKSIETILCPPSIDRTQPPSWKSAIKKIDKEDPSPVDELLPMNEETRDDVESLQLMEPEIESEEGPSPSITSSQLLAQQQRFEANLKEDRTVQSDISIREVRKKDQSKEARKLTDVMLATNQEKKKNKGMWNKLPTALEKPLVRSTDVKKAETSNEKTMKTEETPKTS